MVETNVTELITLYNLIARLEPTEFSTAKKFGMLLSVIMGYQSRIMDYDKNDPEQKKQLTELLNQEVTLKNINFSADEIAHIKMTPIEAYIMAKFVN